MGTGNHAASLGHVILNPFADGRTLKSFLASTISLPGLKTTAAHLTGV